MFCAISGEPPQVPLISVKSGLVYEARLIRRYIEESGKDPITGQELKEEDLVEVKTSPKTAAPRPPTLSSVPALLHSLQNEYDAVMLEMFNLKRQYETVRQELAHALYSNDAANRVVARLMFERDQAREALANVQSTLGGASSSQGAPVPTATASTAQDSEMADGAAAGSAALPVAVDAKIAATAERLSAERRGKMKRKAVPEGYATAADVSSLSQKRSTASLHSTKPPGVTSLALSSNGKLALTGGNDKAVHVHDRAQDKVVATLKGHTKKVVRVEFSKTQVQIGAEADQLPSPTYAVSASEDRSVRTWKLDDDSTESYSLTHTLKGFSSEPTGISIHPCGDFVVSVFRDGHWKMHDLATGEALLDVPPPAAESDGAFGYESVQIHPDGTLMALGTAEGDVHIWDLKSVAKVETLQGHNGAVQTLDFSENGYYLAVAASSTTAPAEVKIWDLRKIAVAGVIALPEEYSSSGPIRAVKFDPAGTFLAVAGNDLRIYANKTWKELRVYDEGLAGEITAVQWDPRNGEIITVGADRTMRVFGAS
ncbi:unnamed protein product [Sympodiomycopsis kandeliae]